MTDSTTSSNYPIVEVLFAGGVGNEVTGSSIILKITNSDGRVRYGMIDAGAIQGENEYLNYEYPINGSEIEFLILTHAHFDHVGAIAILYKQGFRGKIYVTSVTRKLLVPLMVDAASINKRNFEATIGRNFIRKTSNRFMAERALATKYQDKKNFDSVLDQVVDFEKSTCLYDQEDIEALSNQFEEVMPNQETEISEGIHVRFMPSTHQNGACRVELYINDNDNLYTMAFSGDIGPDDSLLYERKYEYTNELVDCFVMESLHGTEEPIETLQVSIRRLYEIIKKGIRQKKHIVLAGFSLDRNAMLVYLMNEFHKRGLYVDTYIDSPLTLTELTSYESMYLSRNAYRYMHWFKEMGKNPFNTRRFKLIKRYREHAVSVLHSDAPRVIITASANGNGGRIIDYFKNGIQREDYIFVFCGWIQPNSPSDRLHETPINKMLEIEGSHFIKKCKTYRLYGLTSHGYINEMLNAVKDYPSCSTLILNHGVEEAKRNVSERVSDIFEGKILIPEMYDAYRLTKGNATVIEQEEYFDIFGRVLKAFNDEIKGTN